MKINAKVTLLIGGRSGSDNDKGATLEITDEDSSTAFFSCEISPENFCAALGRLSNVPCITAEVHALDHVGKRMEHKDFEFPLPDKKTISYHNNRDIAVSEALRLCPAGWKPDPFFSSQNSFFTKNGKPWAQCTIRRWVAKKESPNAS